MMIRRYRGSFSCTLGFFVDSGPMWLLIRGYISHLCGQTPTDLRMGVHAPTTNFASLP
jgi:hypothetical protein